MMVCTPLRHRGCDERGRWESRKEKGHSVARQLLPIYNPHVLSLSSDICLMKALSATYVPKEKELSMQKPRSDYPYQQGTLTRVTCIFSHINWRI